MTGLAPALQTGDTPDKKQETRASKPSIEKPPPPPAANSFTEGGWIEVPSYHPVIVSSLIAGRLEELNVLEGTRVKMGQVIAVLYKKDLKEALDRADAEVAAAAAELALLKAGFRVQEIAKARAELKSAESDLKLEQRVLARTRGLLESGAASAEDLDRHERDLRTAEARRDAAFQDLALKQEGSRKEDIDAASAEHRRRLALRELARNQLSYAVVKSPMAGVVLERFVTAGTFIPATNPRIVSLYDPNDMQVRIDVRQENIGSVFVGQTVDVFTEVERGKTYKGTVIRIDPLADFKKDTVQVKVKLEKPSDRLYPEMIARVRFIMRKDDGWPDRSRRESDQGVPAWRRRDSSAPGPESPGRGR